VIDTSTDLEATVAKVRRLFEDLDSVWDDHSSRVRTWHQITERIAEIDKVIRRQPSIS
jgi:anti-sigma-K factor RskA